MKKIMITLLFMFLLVIGTALQISAEERSYSKKKLEFGTVTVIDSENNELAYDESYERPFIENGVTYLPVRKVGEALNLYVTHDSKTSTIDFNSKKGMVASGKYSQYYGERYSTVTVVNKLINISYDGQLVAENIPAYSINNVTFLPLRQVASFTKSEVIWDSKSRTIYLEKGFSHPNVTRTEIYDHSGNIATNVDSGNEFLNSFSFITPSIVTKLDSEGNIYTAIAESDSNGQLTVTKHDRLLKKLSQVTIKKEYPHFGGITSDPDGNYYVLWGREVLEEKKADISVKITKYDSNLNKIDEVLYPAGEQSAVGTIRPFEHANADIKYNNGLLVAFFGRTMFKSRDGLNHQSSTVLYADANTMKEIKLPVPYVSHSFDQYLTFDGEDNIVFVDRGDAYDRGFVVQKVNTTTSIRSYFVPFYFKMGSAIYQYTYSELGGIQVTEQGYTLIGTSEKTFTTSSAREQHNESRNLFLQLISKNMENDVNPVLTKGESATFRFEFGGRTNDVTNDGIVWLTNYNGKTDNAAHPKVINIGNDKLFIIWENIKRHSDSSYYYNTTYYMVVTPEGEVLHAPEEIKNARLNIGAWPYYSDGYVYWSSGTKRNIYLYQVDVRHLQ